MKKKLKLSMAFISALLALTGMFAKKHKDKLPQDFNSNEVPYISTYYIKPIVKPGENVILDFYITDYNHKSYIEEDLSNLFTVTIKIEGKKDIVKKNLKPGDNSINIGKFKNTGEQKFSILCTDKYGRNSHELFNYFLVRNEPLINEYIMTKEDLVTYNIKNDDNKEYGENTRKGLQQLLDDKKNLGFNKLKLLPGIYKIDHSDSIFIPTEFTLDLNQATIKLNGFTGDKATMIQLNNTFDSHVINGTIEGDYYEHDYENSPSNSEWVMGVSIVGESKYSSFEDLTIKNITGYGAGNGIGYSRDRSLGYSYVNYTPIGNTFTLGSIDRKTGETIESSTTTTCDFIDIAPYSKIGYLTVSKHLGYQGNYWDTWNIICHYYDENKNFISSVDGYQYRRIGVPSNAKYMKVTILAENYPTDLSVQLFRVPTHCSFKNIKFENCRAVGLAQSAMNNMLVENCEFTNCGQTLAKCAYDAEDGWDMMQDVTLRGLNFYDNPNNDLLTCAGHNFIIENMKDGKIYTWERTNSFIIRNCNNIKNSTLRNGGRKQTGYVRFYNNTVNSNLNIANNEAWPIIAKDSIINGNAMGKYLRCTIGPNVEQIKNNFESGLGKGEFIDCYIHDKTGENNGGIYYNCTLENISGNIHSTLEVTNSTLSNINVYAGQYDPNYTFKNSTITNLEITLGYWHKGCEILIEDCKINNKKFLIKLPHYSLKKPMTLISNTIVCESSNGLINFYDDRLYNTDTNSDNIKLEKNSIILPNSNYIIEGLNENTINTINITNNYNNITPNNILIINPLALNSSNISINNN